MAITLGAVTFDDAHTHVRERHEEVGGRDERRIEMSGLVVGESTTASLEARIDAILAAASEEDYTAELSLRQGRRFWVRRDEFLREISPESLVGSFVLKLSAKDPFEESTTQIVAYWTITASGAAKVFTPSGNVFAKPIITLVATGNLVNPSFDDGSRRISYAGAAPVGATLVFDACTGKVTLDDEDVTPYTSGDFPRLSPGGTTLIYTDEGSSSHSAGVTVAYRSRWW